MNFNQNTQLDNNQSNSSEREDDREMKKSVKGNTKNTYIKKIGSLLKMSNNDLMGSEFQNQNSNSNEKKLTGNRLSGFKPDLDGSRGEDKLAKNRESARNSRKRKKIYLQLLENKVTVLSDQLETFRSVQEKTLGLDTQLCTKIKTRKEQDNTKIILLNNMQNAIYSNTSESNINSIIDSLNKKFGASSIDRNNQLEHYFQQIQENILSPYACFLIGRAGSNGDMFDFVDNDKTLNNLLKRLKLTDKQKQVINKKKNKLQKCYGEISNSLSAVQDIKFQIQTELGGLDQTLEMLRRELKPSQVAKFLMSIQNKDTQGHYREPFERCFGGGDGVDDEDSLDLFQFMNEHNICNSLGIDVQQAYEIYKSSQQFLASNKEENQNVQKQEKVEKVEP